ncbi:MAG: transglutaminase domain-containing protein [Prevotella sp.]|nr:transglutaminase domain-containing protein [Prevotella sp.]
MKKQFLRIAHIGCFMVVSSMSAVAQDGHFITNPAYRAKVEQAFNEKMECMASKFYHPESISMTDKEREAMMFLYAYMPLADITDYAAEYHLMNVRTAFRTQQEMTWGKDVPELLFRHFVLPMRVNNEPLDMSRPIFYKELKKRVEGMSMADAILEVNHWCHEHVTYQPSDARTLSPLATINTAIGRCGEESTFTVAALRSIGIPARQVYTPRWAHTDDNHAWVEAWADGKWHFMGACEPEPVLDLGWFNAPASRAMLMHTRAFGDYNGPEEVMLRTSNYTEINLIDNYGSTARVDFQVVDRKGKGVEGARVDFKIYNYAEFCTVVTKYADKQGHTFLTAGKGDMLVWASKDGWYGYGKASFGKDKTIRIILNHNNRIPSSLPQKAETLDIVPPVENAQLPKITEEQIAKNKERLIYEDSIRKNYETTFLSIEEAKAIYENAASYLHMARGNWKTIAKFIFQHPENEERALSILKSLSNKDLQDIDIEILEDNYQATSNQLSPRVENEMITKPFKQFFEKEWQKETINVDEIRQDPALLVKWVKENIQLHPDHTALRIAQTPVGVWNAKMTDARSRDIFFVDLARALGVEARKDPVTGKVQYKNNRNVWIDVDFQNNEQKVAKTGTLALSFESNTLTDNPKYYSHFTITRIHDDGTTQLMNFEEGQVDMGGGTSWANTFKEGTTLDVGTYLLTTGTRLANGNVMAENRFFTIEEGKNTTLPLHLRYDKNEVSVIGNFDSESKFDKGENRVSILSQTGRGFFVVGILGMGEEPTNHALRDIAKESTAIDEWERPLVLLFNSESDMEKYQKEHSATMPKHVILGIDTDQSIRKQIIKEMKMDNDRQLPIFIIADTFNRVVFASQGYTIGLGEQLVKTIRKIK